MVKPKALSIEELKEKARQVRISLIKALAEAKSGHSGGSMGLADVYTALYFNVMNHDPDNPNWEERDRFILSIGHVAPIRYAAMAHSGYFPVEELMTLRKFNSRLQGHPHALDLPGLETSSGSLGQGLSVSVGIALGAKMDGKGYNVYCSMGDGELQEGSIWEAAMAGAKFKLKNLIGFIDRNSLQIDGHTEEVMPLEPLRDKWEDFGWEVIEADGHDFREILDAFENAKRSKSEKPKVILFTTTMGKGCSFMEGDESWHGKTPTKEEAERALKELEAGHA